MIVQVPETFESTSILADNFCTGEQDAHTEQRRDSTTRLNKTWLLSVKYIPITAYIQFIASQYGFSEVISCWLLKTQSWNAWNSPFYSRVLICVG